MGLDMDKMRAQAAQIKERREESRERANISVRRGGKPKNINIECLYTDDDVVYLHFERLEHSHKKAVLIKFNDDQKEWMPFSQIRDIDLDDKVLVCSEWIASQKGLEPIEVGY